MGVVRTFFDHTEPGISEEQWWSAPQWADVPVLDLPATAATFRRALVVSAHPDDETLGAGGLLADLADAGMDLTVLVATSGERSHPVPDEASAHQLGTRRRREVEHAISCLAPQARLVHLGLPDNGLYEEMNHMIAGIAARADADTLVIAPWTHDGHGDHDAIGAAAALAASSISATVVHYPIWLWHWADTTSVPWTKVVGSYTSLVGCWRKRSALAAFTTQINGWEPTPGGSETPPMLGSAALSRARRLIETLIDPAGALPTISVADTSHRRRQRRETMDRMYASSPDPWGWADSFYEQRRRTLVLGMLGRRHYERVLELGCADGHISSALLERCDALDAVDASDRAVQATAKAAPGARVIRGDLPSDMPRGSYDLIVVSEVGYFLTAGELIATIAQAKSALAPGGELLLCHWQHPTLDIPLDGFLVHEQAHSLMGSAPSASYHDEDVSIDVWTSAPSSAEREGRR
ncbi:MAG: bifunctional PIG-L family deacetylase/class I SAM-dependent methyltransferase [Ornithinimicrobium sp.]